MAERRLKQWVVLGSLWDDALQDGQSGLQACIDLLKKYQLVPEDAIPTHCFADPWQDVSILRFKHESFPCVEEFGRIVTVTVFRADVGLS